MNLPNKPKVLAATFNPVSNTKMISFLVDFPTVLLAELRTHRILTQGSLYEHSELTDLNLSANSARAIPHNKYLQKVLDNPFIPIWTKQQKGMSGNLVPNPNCQTKSWLNNLEVSDYPSDVGFYDTLLDSYNRLIECGTHKQNANRLLAPFAYTTCILSGTEWRNFFELRCPKYELKLSNPITKEVISTHLFKSKKEYLKFAKKQQEDLFESINEVVNLDEKLKEYKEPNWQSINKSTAQPEFQIIAEMLYDLYQEAEWKESKYHIPFEDDIVKLYKNDLFTLNNSEYDNESYCKDLMKISASMCAKLSYNTQDNEDTLEKHLERANFLLSEPHPEPFAHQSVAMDKDSYNDFYRSTIKRVDGEMKAVKEYGWCYNLNGFISHRYMIENF